MNVVLHKQRAENAAMNDQLPDNQPDEEMADTLQMHGGDAQEFEVKLPGRVSDGSVPQPNDLESVPTMVSIDSDGHHEESRQTYETFVDDQLHALKAQLLAYHMQQSIRCGNGISSPSHDMQLSKFQESGSSPSLPKKKHNEQLVVALDILALPPPSETASRKTHRRKSSATRVSFAYGFPTARYENESSEIWSYFTLTEENKFRQVWSQAVVGFLIAYVATVFPYKLAFLDFRIQSEETSEPVGWIVVQMIVDVCFWIDLTLNFFTSFRNGEDCEICDLRSIAKRYLKGMFFLDLLACLPSEFFQLITNPDGSSNRASPTRAINLTKLQRLTRLVRILRLRQLLKLAEVEWVQAVMRFRGFRMVGLAVGVLWVVHLMGSGWYIIASLEAKPMDESWVARRALPDGGTLLDKPPEVQWAHSMYFVLTVFTTVGFGDMSAHTTGEIVYVCMLMMVGGVVNGTVLSYVMSILEESDRKDVAINRTVNTLKDFADHTQLSSSLTHQMVTLARERRVGAEVDSEGMKKLFSSLILPRHVVAKLPPNLWKGRLLRNDLLQHTRRLRQMRELPPRMTLFIASMLSMREFNQEEILYSVGDLPANIFLVLDGVFSYVAVPQGLDTVDLSPYQLLGPRSFFGESEMLTQVESRQSTVRCESPSATALLLAKVDFVKLCADCPGFASAVHILAIRREASRKRRLARLVKIQTYEQLSCDILRPFFNKLLPGREPARMSNGKAWS